MPELRPGRSYLSIGEVLEALKESFPDVTISKIRFFEGQGLLVPERTPSGYRKFRDGDVARLAWVLHQQKQNFLPLKVIKARLDSCVFKGAVKESGQWRAVLFPFGNLQQAERARQALAVQGLAVEMIEF